MSNRYFRAVRQHLRNAYGVMHVDFVRGGNHPRAKFDYHGHNYTLTLYRGHDIGASTIEMKLRDIARELGPPPAPKPSRFRQTLKEMTAMLEQSHVGNGNGALPTTVAAAEPVNGRIALYADSTKSQFRLRFFVPEEIALAFGNQAVEIARASPDTWHLIPREGKKPQIRKDGKGYILDCFTLSATEGFSMPFGASPAEYLLVDGNALVRLFTDQLKPIADFSAGSHREAAAEPVGAPEAAEAAAPPPAANPPAIAAPPSLPIVMYRMDDRLRQLLTDITEIEKLTPYRLIKRVRNGQWAWRVPMVTLDESTPDHEQC